MKRKQVKPGQQFGRLTVIRETEKRNDRLQVLCRCLCGKEKEVDIYSLLYGLVKSCGCLARENIKKVSKQRIENLTGKRFGRLIAQKLVGSQNEHSVWRCICDCGKQTDVLSINLTSGRTLSCGCILVEYAKTLGSS